MPGTLGLGLDLQRIITRGADAVVDVDALEESSARLVHCVREISEAAAQSVAGNCAAGAGVIKVLIELAHQNMRAARTPVAHRQHNIAWHLALYVQIELLNDPLFEIAVLRLNGSSIEQRIHRRAQDRAARHGRRRRRTSRDQEAIGEAAAGAGGGGAKSPRIHFRIIWGILPQPLSALVPRGIVDDTIPPTNRGFFAPHGLPRESDPWFQSGLVKPDADSSVGGNAGGAAADSGAAFWNVPFKVLNIEIRLPIGLLRFRRRQRPGKSKVQG